MADLTGGDVIFRNLETPRLLLRNISDEDTELVYSLFSDNEVNRYLFDAEPLKDLHGAEEIISYYTESEPRSHHRWVLIIKETGTAIGTCGFHRWDREAAGCDIGYDLLPGFRGNGYMSEALQEIISFADKVMRVRTIYACIYSKNTKSIRLAESSGFKFCGQMRDEVFRGEVYPHRVYELHL